MKEKDTGNTVLVVDGGGRGSALVDKYAQSKHVDRILAVPGNDLMKINTDKPVQIYPELKTTSVKEILEICKREQVGLVDVAQDSAVEIGLPDELKKIKDGSDLDVIKKATEELSQVAQKVGAEMYQKASAEKGASSSPETTDTEAKSAGKEEKPIEGEIEKEEGEGK